MPTLFSKLGQAGLEAGAPRPPKSLAGGMTLIELLVAIAMLALGISGILALQVQTMDAGALASGRSMAIFLAESQSEWLRAMAPSRVEFVSPAPEKLTVSGQLCEDAPGETCFFTRTTTIVKGVPTSTSYAVSIKVQWQNKQVVYDTVVSGLGFF